MPALPHGKYRLFGVIDYGGPALAAARADLEVR
jgi:hypothetical protein